MLMQSHSGEINLLPALPAEWPKGGITGLRGRGDYTIDMEWDKHQLIDATLISGMTQTCRLRTKKAVKILLSGKNVPAKQLEKNLYVLKLLLVRNIKLKMPVLTNKKDSAALSFYKFDKRNENFLLY
jgi:hypothetical protein